MTGFVIGIDPGLTGAIALLRDGKFAEAIDMPTSGRGQGGKQDLNHAELARIFRELPPCTAYVEHVWGYNRDGVKQSSAAGFRLGLCVGTIRQALASHGFPMELVVPQKWKKDMGLIGTDKDAARTKAIQLFPDAPLARKKDIGRADALLLALYGYRVERR
jgi:crossover junction endodeoxyribonuclease RuvC